MTLLFWPARLTVRIDSAALFGEVSLRLGPLVWRSRAAKRLAKLLHQPDTAIGLVLSRRFARDLMILLRSLVRPETRGAVHLKADLGAAHRNDLLAQRTAAELALARPHVQAIFSFEQASVPGAHLSFRLTRRIAPVLFVIFWGRFVRGLRVPARLARASAGATARADESNADED